MMQKSLPRRAGFLSAYILYCDLLVQLFSLDGEHFAIGGAFYFTIVAG